MNLVLLNQRKKIARRAHFSDNNRPSLSFRNSRSEFSESSNTFWRTATSNGILFAGVRLRKKANSSVCIQTHRQRTGDKRPKIRHLSDSRGNDGLRYFTYSRALRSKNQIYAEQ